MQYINGQWVETGKTQAELEESQFKSQISGRTFENLTQGEQEKAIQMGLTTGEMSEEQKAQSRAEREARAAAFNANLPSSTPERGVRYKQATTPTGSGFVGGITGQETISDTASARGAAGYRTSPGSQAGVSPDVTQAARAGEQTTTDLIQDVLGGGFDKSSGTGAGTPESPFTFSPESLKAITDYANIYKQQQQ